MINLPDNVHKNIAQFLQPTLYKCYIRLQQDGGCPQGTHIRDKIIEECENCRNIYNNSKLFVYLKKGSNKYLFNKYIEIIKAKIENDFFQLKCDYSQWPSMNRDRNLRMNDLFIEQQYQSLVLDRFYKDNEMRYWEIDKYEERYVIYGIYWALFHKIIEELHPITGFYSSIRDVEKTDAMTSSGYYDIRGEKYTQSLCAINKLYNRYCIK